MNLPAALVLLASTIIWNFGLTIAATEPDSSFSETETSSSTSTKSGSGSSSSPWHRVEGKVIPPLDKKTNEWLIATQVLVNGGEHIGLLREDGSFLVEGLSPGSHIIEVVSPQLQYESARVDITSKGKLRARKVNNIQPAQVIL
jgi:hypothetical protein